MAVTTWATLGLIAPWIGMFCPAPPQSKTVLQTILTDAVREAAVLLQADPHARQGNTGMCLQAEARVIAGLLTVPPPPQVHVPRVNIGTRLPGVPMGVAYPLNIPQAIRLLLALKPAAHGTALRIIAECLILLPLGPAGRDITGAMEPACQVLQQLLRAVRVLRVPTGCLIMAAIVCQIAEARLLIPRLLRVIPRQALLIPR